MTHTNPLADEYRELIAYWARALAGGHGDAVEEGLADPATAPGVEQYLTTCFGQRYRSLERGTELLEGGFSNLHELRLRYIREVPLAAYNPNSGDGKRFLEWLERTHDLTAEQQDFWACQWAPHAVAELARSNRLGHVHFQELRSVAGELSEELESNPELHIVLNPIVHWARFQTAALLEGAGEPPMDVLFYASGTEVATAVLETSGLELVRELARLGPCTLKKWARAGKRSGRKQLIQLCRNLAGMGLIAFQ